MKPDIDPILPNSNNSTSDTQKPSIQPNSPSSQVLSHERVIVPLNSDASPEEPVSSSATQTSLDQPMVSSEIKNFDNAQSTYDISQLATSPQILNGNFQQSSEQHQPIETPSSVNCSFSPNMKPFSLRNIFILLALALLARAVHFGFGVFAGLLVFGGAGPLGPIILVFIPNIVILFFGTKHFLSLSKKEATIFSTIITTLIAFGLLNVIVGFNFSDLLSGESSVINGLLSQIATLGSVWLVMTLLYSGIVLARSGRSVKVFACFGMIILTIITINIYTYSSTSNSFNEFIEEESVSRYADITFTPYATNSQIEDYSIDGTAYITNYESGLSDLITYYVTEEGKSARNYSIQQYEYSSAENPAENCDDLSGNQRLYYPTTLKFQCIYIGESNQSSSVYFLEPDEETIQKKYLRHDTAFTTINNLLVIIRVTNVPDPEESLGIIQEITKRLEPVEKKEFFEQFRQITTRDSDR